MAAIFDTYFIVDWSASNEEKRGKDSIWIAEARRTSGRVHFPEQDNPATRAEAMQILEERMSEEISKGRRVFAGFDFPFGYPAGAAARITGTPKWESLWRWLFDEIVDEDDNRSNRFALADRLNRDCFRSPVYWGRPANHNYSHLPTKKQESGSRNDFEFRIVEKRHRPAKSVWQLNYNGAVGGQALLGIARLERLRRRFVNQVQIWPFETEFSARIHAPLIIAEIYPSIFEVSPRAGEVKDCAQVRTLVEKFSALDSRGCFLEWLAAPKFLRKSELTTILEEEGWIVGPSGKSE